MIHDIVDYKYAKVFVNDLNKIITILEKSEQELQIWIKYTPVLKALNSPGGIRDALTTAKAYRDFYTSVIKNKGVKNGKL